MKRRSLLVWLGVGIACAVCCAPLLLPLFVAGAAGVSTFAGGRLLGLPLDVVVCGSIILAIAAAIGLWLARSRRAAAANACDCTSACDVEACGPRNQSQESAT